MYVELPEVGSEVKQKEQFGVVESVKASRTLIISEAALFLPALTCLVARLMHPASLTQDTHTAFGCVNMWRLEC